MGLLKKTTLTGLISLHQLSSETRVLYNALLDHEWYRESVVEGRRVLGMLFVLNS